MKALELHQMANIKGGQDQTAEVLACTFDGLVMVGINPCPCNWRADFGYMGVRLGFYDGLLFFPRLNYVTININDMRNKYQMFLVILALLSLSMVIYMYYHSMIRVGILITSGLTSLLVIYLKKNQRNV